MAKKKPALGEDVAFMADVRAAMIVEATPIAAKWRYRSMRAPWSAPQPGSVSASDTGGFWICSSAKRGSM